MVFKGKKSRSNINHWLREFQETINKIAGNNFLKFTECIWSYGCNSPPPMRTNKVDKIKENIFPYLDMKLCWMDKGELELAVFRKPNQELK